jgi:hypothetical protein
VSVNVSIEVRGIDQLQRALRRAPELIKKRMGPALRRAGLHIEREAKLGLRREGISGATGKLQQSIVTTLDEDKLEARVGPRLQVAPYAHHIELGRKPAGALDGKGPPVKFGSSLNRPFARWAEKKAGVTGALGGKRNSDLYLIARAIKRKGWVAKPYMAPAAERAQAQVIAEVEKGVDQALRDFGNG